METAPTPTQSQSDDKSETHWTDDRIRWTEDQHDDRSGDNLDEEETNPFDPFQDANPFTTFDFEFAPDIHITLRGYKTDADQVWQSTGVTLWRAAEHLGHYLAKQPTIEWPRRRVLEVSAETGLGVV